MGMRVGGLASGMDIDQIVSDLMKVERVPLDKLNQKKQVLEWQRDDYRSINTNLTDFDKNIFEGINRQSSFTKKIVSSTDQNAVSARNINGTSNVYSTIRVDQLAEAAYMNSSADIRSNTAFNPDNILNDERANLTTDFTSNTFTIQAIKADGTLGGVVSFTIDPATDSLNDVLDDINNSAAGVNAFYDSQTGKISMTAKNTGDVSGQAEILVTGDFLTGSLGLASNNIAAGANGNEGKNALFNINGLNTQRSSNTFQINGYEYTLKQVTDNGDGVTQAGELVTITSTTDTDSIYNTVMDFVNKYNETIDKLNSKTSEERYRTYPPLTAEQKKGLTGNEIELWEAKAKSGLLRNDAIISSGLNKMRLDIYSPVSGLSSEYSQLTQIGITTSSNYREKGKLIVDENKLREAINNDPMAVNDLFNKKVTDVNGKIVSEESGIAVRLRDSIKGTVSNIETKAGNVYKTNDQYSIGMDLTRVDKDIFRLESRLIDIENRYWREFNAMEQAIQKSNEQAAYLDEQFSQM